MNNEWTRDDLPHQHEVWDDFVAGKHSDVFHAVDADDLGEVLDEVINHLNAHHPKPRFLIEPDNQKLHNEWMIEHIRANAAEERVRQLEDYIRGEK